MHGKMSNIYLTVKISFLSNFENEYKNSNTKTHTNLSQSIAWCCYRTAMLCERLKIKRLFFSSRCTCTGQYRTARNCRRDISGTMRSWQIRKDRNTQQGTDYVQVRPEFSIFPAWTEFKCISGSSCPLCRSAFH